VLRDNGATGDVGSGWGTLTGPLAPGIHHFECLIHPWSARLSKSAEFAVVSAASQAPCYPGDEVPGGEQHSRRRNGERRVPHETTKTPD
jgi:hypothetical protein